MQSDLEVADVFRDGANRFLSQSGRRHSPGKRARKGQEKGTGPFLMAPLMEEGD